MFRSLIFKSVLAISMVSSVSPAMAAIDRGTGQICQSDLTHYIPDRSNRALTASKVTAKAKRLHGKKRDELILRQVMSGNIPDFLRRLQPVSFKKRIAGRLRTVTLCVMPDYMAVGSNKDFLRVPMGLDAAMIIADQFDFVLPTTKMVDVIHSKADTRLRPKPMKPGRLMTSTNYFARHNKLVESQRKKKDLPLGMLLAGHKKDLVISNRMWKRSNRVAIYGWHYPNGKRIQPLSTVHGKGYADYSHGVRLVSTTAYVDGKRTSLYKLLGDRKLASMVSKEGRMRNANRLVASNRTASRSRMLAAVNFKRKASPTQMMASAKPQKKVGRTPTSILPKLALNYAPDMIPFSYAPDLLSVEPKQKRAPARVIAPIKQTKKETSKKKKVKVASKRVKSAWNASFL